MCAVHLPDISNISDEVDVDAVQAVAAQEAAQAAEMQRQADDMARRLRIQAEKEALLSPELAADSDIPCVTLMFRLPDGTRLSRRFGLQQRLQELYYFCDSKVRSVGGNGLAGQMLIWIIFSMRSATFVRYGQVVCCCNAQHQCPWNILVIQHIASAVT